ncbi:MAG TPA: SgcJ/EcaC family oxidoreductase [Gemmataceae bacterium]|jgi:uncharacterized protein (TIGR02246 family)
MKTKACLLATGGVLVVLVAFLTIPVRSAGENGTASPAKAVPAESQETKRVDDERAVRKASADFIKMVEKGDAKAVAASWTEDGEYIGDDGTTIRGRAAIEAAYAKAFARNKKLKIEITVESIRFPSKDTAIEEGYAKSYKGNSEYPTASRYSVLHVREGGRWLMALLREWPDEGVSLRDLDWLIGTWEAKAGETEVRTAYEWDAKKNSIRCHITIKGKGRTVTATQVLLKDPRTGQLRSWLFDDDGGFGDAAWTHDGKRWVIAATGVQADGGELTATNILTPVDKDTFIWQSTERKLDGEELPSIQPAKVRRVK